MIITDLLHMKLLATGERRGIMTLWLIISVICVLVGSSLILHEASDGISHLRTFLREKLFNLPPIPKDEKKKIDPILVSLGYAVTFIGIMVFIIPLNSWCFEGITGYKLSESGLMWLSLLLSIFVGFVTTPSVPSST